MVCAACVHSLRAHGHGDQATCDFCDHPRGGCARAQAKGDVAICADCLAFARQVLGDDGGGEGVDTEDTRLDADLLWSDLTPAPRPDVDPDAPATAHADLAIAFYELGLLEDARDQLKKALSLDPLHPVALHLLEKLPAPVNRV